jgi:DNA ligase-1
MQTSSRRRFGAQILGGLLALQLLPKWALARTNGADVLLAQDYPPGTNPARYLVSEKFDGVRAVWDGKVLVFRSGRSIAAPAWFTARLPAIALDGELWLARGQFEVLSGIVRKATPVDDEWRRVQYLVFELPGGPGRFADRAQRLREVVQAVNWPQLQAVEQFSVADAPALQRKLAEVVQSGGEGLVLHRADAPYLTGRNPALLKLKPQQDAEAKVIAHVPGKGKYAGLLGALAVQAEDGRRFKIGTGLTDTLRNNPPPVGSTITYTYQGRTAQGVPRFAAFLRTHDGI